MPIYEYQCEDCSKDFELLIMRRSEADNQVCPSCSSANVHRKMSAFARPGGGGGCGDNCTCSTPST